MSNKNEKLNEFEFVRLAGDERRTGTTLESVSRHWQSKRERFLFLSPHDDDIALGAGLLVQLAQRENVPIYIMIVTDGSMGYCSNQERESISEIRRQESYESYKRLGVPEENIIWLGFPDCQLNRYQGRRPAEKDSASQIAGFTGMQNAFTYWIRKINPTQCFLPTSNDLHPDHKIVHSEFLISLFHAAGSIWPELSVPIEKVPYIHEIGVYCDFPSPPRLRMRSSQEFLQNKLDAIACFKSQKQIGSLVDIVSQNGPFEYTRPVEFSLYQPGAYYTMFEKRHHSGFIR